MSLTSLAAAEIERGDSPDMSIALIEKQLLDAAHRVPKLSIPTGSLGYIKNRQLPTSPKNPDREPPNPFQSLVKYIPAESTTLYLASASAGEALVITFPFFTPMVAYWSFVVLTPTLFMLILAGQRKSKNLSAFPKMRKLPYWKIFASTTAFAVWGLAVPTNPYSTNADRGAAFAFMAVVVSTILGMLEGIFEPKGTKKR